MTKQKRSLLNLDRLGRAYGVRPSAVVGIEDEWAAYQFDMAALALGNRVERALADKEDVEAILGGKPSKSRAKQFASAKRFARKMQVPASGVW